MNQSTRDWLSDKFQPKTQPSIPTNTNNDTNKKLETVNEEPEQELDSSGLDENDIKMVMEQGNVPRNKAITALRNNDGDIVNAIMQLTM